MSGEQERDAEYHLLAIDAELLKQRILDLRAKNETFSNLVQEAIEQSSETTHDNAPYDAAREAKTQNAQRIHELEAIGRRANIYTPTEESVVDMGSVVVLENNGVTQKIEVAGDWHDRHDDEHTVVSRNTPLASAIIGKTLDDTISLVDGSQWKISALSNPYVVSHESDHKEETTEQDNEKMMDEWKSNRLLFVCGHHASGKSRLIDKALEDDFVVFDTGPALREIHEKEAPDLDFEEWVKNGEDTYGKNYTNELLRHKLEEIRDIIDKEGRQGTVIIGFRTREGIDYIIEHIDHSDAKIMYVVATKKLMLERYRMRKGKAKVTQEEFDEIIEDESKRGLMYLARNSDFKVVNHGRIDDAIAKIKASIESWQPEA